MGLDLYLVQKQKDGTERELCYGRKTWHIAEFFMTHGEPLDGGECFWRVPFRAWKNFINRARAFDLEEMETLTTIFMKGEETTEEAEKVEDFVCSFSDGYPSLGFAWEADAILRWVDEDEEVRAAFEETPDSIYLIASYQLKNFW